MSVDCSCVAQVFSWKDIVDAHKEMEANKNSGKVSVNGGELDWAAFNV